MFVQCTETLSWANNEHLKHYLGIHTCRRANILIPGPKRQLPWSSLELSSRELKVFVGLLAGHTPRNRHHYAKTHFSVCATCSDEEETAFHYTGT